MIHSAETDDLTALALMPSRSPQTSSTPPSALPEGSHYRDATAALRRELERLRVTHRRNADSFRSDYVRLYALQQAKMDAAALGILIACALVAAMLMIALSDSLLTLAMGQEASRILVQLLIVSLPAMLLAAGVGYWRCKRWPPDFLAKLRTEHRDVYIQIEVARRFAPLDAALAKLYIRQRRSDALLFSTVFMIAVVVVFAMFSPGGIDALLAPPIDWTPPFTSLDAGFALTTSAAAGILMVTGWRRLRALSWLAHIALAGMSPLVAATMTSLPSRIEVAIYIGLVALLYLLRRIHKL